MIGLERKVSSDNGMLCRQQGREILLIHNYSSGL